MHLAVLLLSLSFIFRIAFFFCVLFQSNILSLSHFRRVPIMICIVAANRITTCQYCYFSFYAHLPFSLLGLMCPCPCVCNQIGHTIGICFTTFDSNTPTLLPHLVKKFVFLNVFLADPFFLSSFCAPFSTIRSTQSLAACLAM